MKKCTLCNSENLRISKATSKIIPGAKYAACNSCGNVNLLVNDVMIPTPQAEGKMTTALIKDAAEAFGTENLRRVSITGEDTVPMREIKTEIENYINSYMDNEEICEVCGESPCICDKLLEKDLDEFECDYDCDNCDEGCPDFEEKKAAAIKNGTPVYVEQINGQISIDSLPEINTTITKITGNGTGNKNYVLFVEETGEKKFFYNCSKEFILNIINDIGTHVKLYEMKEVKLKEKVTYSF